MARSVCYHKIKGRYVRAGTKSKTKRRSVRRAAKKRVGHHCRHCGHAGYGRSCRACGVERLRSRRRSAYTTYGGTTRFCRSCGKSCRVSHLCNRESMRSQKRLGITRMRNRRKKRKGLDDPFQVMDYRKNVSYNL